MDKLTWYDSDGRINCRRGYEVALAQLASYEATGMMPDEIVKMGMAYEDSKRYSGRLELKLMPYLNIGLSPGELKALMLASTGKCVAEIKAFDGVGIDRLCDLAEADRDGRVVVLPCKVGDKLYRVFAGEIFEHRVGSMKYFAIQGRWDIETYPFCPCVESSIGKTIFLTREEAEKALEAMEDGN